MPAVTPVDTTVASHRRRRDRRGPSGRAGRDRGELLRGRGIPRAPAVPGRARPRSTPIRSSCSTRWARSTTRPGKAVGAPDHPHRGFETVTYLIDGEMEHRDSHGGGGVIRGGDTQWMTAGAGLVHSEMPTEKMMREGGLLHGVQLWVNLPRVRQARRAALPRHHRRRAHAVPQRRRHRGRTAHRR